MKSKPLQFVGFKGYGLPIVSLRRDAAKVIKQSRSISLAVSAISTVIMPDAYHLMESDSDSDSPLAPEELLELLRIKPPRQTNKLKDVILERVGLTSSDLMPPPHQMTGPLDELKASNLLQGPFKITLTRRPRYHLTFDESCGVPTVRLLDFNVIKSFFTPQISGIVM